MNLISPCLTFWEGGGDNREMHEGCCTEIVKRDRSWENMDRNQLALVCSTLSFFSYDYFKSHLCKKGICKIDIKVYAETQCSS